MSRCAYCGGGITAFDIVSRTRTARYHEDCRTRELGLPYEPWLPIRIVMFLWDMRFAAWNVLKSLWGELAGSQSALGDQSEYRSKRSARERSDEIGMKHGDPWL